MANANKVKKNIRRALQESKEGRLEAGTVDGLKELADASDMTTPNLLELLTSMRHQRLVRTFGLQNGNAYIQA